MIDCHSILVENLECEGNLSEEEKKIKTLIVSTNREDWVHMIKIIENFNVDIYEFGIGLHPWFIKEEEYSHEEDINYLKELLIQYPKLRIGEVGLDKIRKTTFPFQVKLFQQQLQLASQYQRSISIHCVRAHGTLLMILRELNQQLHIEPPRGFFFHSWSGSDQITKDILRLNRIGRFCYFGISAKINAKNLDLISAIPPDRIITESDLFLNDRNRLDLLQSALKSIQLLYPKLNNEKIEENYQEFLGFQKNN